jgi:hypothetical protein
VPGAVGVRVSYAISSLLVIGMSLSDESEDAAQGLPSRERETADA